MTRTGGPEDFSVDGLRHRVEDRLGGSAPAPDSLGDHILNPSWTQAAVRHPRAASVLVPLVPRRGGVSVMLTRRADHLDIHAGQIAFPGGKVGPEDQSALAAALREAFEEVGLGPDFVDVIGRLGEYHTATGFNITPFLGIVRPGFTLAADASEVAEIFEAPLQFFMTPANHKVHGVIWRGRPRRFYAMPYRNHYIWGATAGILRHMYERLYSE